MRQSESEWKSKNYEEKIGQHFFSKNSSLTFFISAKRTHYCYYCSIATERKHFSINHESGIFFTKHIILKYQKCWCATNTNTRVSFLSLTIACAQLGFRYLVVAVHGDVSDTFFCLSVPTYVSHSLSLDIGMCVFVWNNLLLRCEPPQICVRVSVIKRIWEWT